MIEDFFHMRCEKIRNGPNGIHGAWGKLIHEKKPEVENLVTLSF